MPDTQATADTATNLDAAPAGVVAVETVTPDIATRVSEAKTPEELAQLTKEFFDTEGKAPKVEETVVAEAAVEAAEVVAETETAEVAEEKAGEKPTEETTAETDDEPEGETASGKAKQFRLRPLDGDKVEKRAFELKKFNRDLSMKECIARAEKEILGEKAGTTETATTDGLPETVEAAQAKLLELRAAKSKAMREELDLAKADDLDIEMDKLRDHVVVLKSKAQETQTREEQKYLQEFGESQKKASGLYNFLSDEKSAGFARAREIDAAMKENNDPLFYSTDKPLVIAQMVAAELRIAPKSAKAPVVSPAAVVKTVASKPVSVISSGGSRTASQSTQIGQQMDQIAAVKSFDDLRKLGVNVG